MMVGIPLSWQAAKGAAQAPQTGDLMPPSDTSGFSYRKGSLLSNDQLHQQPLLSQALVL